MTSLHSLLFDIIPDFATMPLLKVAIIEMIATIVEKHGIDLEECSKVTLESNYSFFSDTNYTQ